MSLILKLRGSRAVSAFRLDKVNSRLATIQQSVQAVAAEHWHFVEAERPLAARETEVLERLLQYGEPARAGEGRMLLSVPRLGTISPWSSKATDIARRCGLEAVRRVERGTAWFFSGGRALDSELHRILDGASQEETLFGMIKTTHARNPAGTVVAYSDNAAVIEGRAIARFYPGSDGRYGYRDEVTHTLMKCETHNHPTAISPFPGAG